jgi:ribonuclease HII
MRALQRYPWRQATHHPVVGVDEVGRGCLAGPVFAAAVILNPKKVPRGLTDSKLLSAERRAVLAKAIQGTAQVGIGIASEQEIEELNILYASLLAMKRAVLALAVEAAGLLLVDGKFAVPDLIEWQQQCLIKGELRAAPIAAASIVAKVTRDLEMVRLSEEYPGYGFEIHKGYATKVHRDAIQRLGVTPIHRRHFAGVAEFIAELTPVG